MTPEERARIEWLCKQIQAEHDQQKFNDLVHELNQLLEKKEPPLADKLRNVRAS